MNDIVYRIIDANFNRAREALRVMEEYCRFGLNNAALIARAKQMRHQLCDVIAKFDSLKLLGSRDTAGDVGREMKVQGQLSRMSLEDCFTAGAKRASEALRALAEACQTIDLQASSVMEQLRFGVYALEKDTVLYANVRHKFESVRLYVIVNAGESIDNKSILALSAQCVSGGADCLQLRAKNISDSALLLLAKEFVQLCRDKGALSIINDRIDIALLSGADGVHLGQDDIPITEARRLAKGPMIIGASTHNTAELDRAIESGFDYVGVGPAFASPTKPQIKVVGLDYLSEAAKRLESTGVYAVAIGGIDETNIGQVLETKIGAVAVSSCVQRCPSPQAYCKALKDKLLSYKNS